MRAKSSKQRCPALCILDLSYNVKYHWSCRVGGCYGHLTASGSWHGFPGVDHEGRQDIAKLGTMPTSARKCFFRTRANTTSAAVDGRLGLFTNFGRVGSQLINLAVSVICHGFVMGSDQNLPTFAPITGEDFLLSSPVFWQNIAIYRQIPTAFFGTAALSATQFARNPPLLINPTKIKGPYHLRSRFFGETGFVVVLEVLVIL